MSMPAETLELLQKTAQEAAGPQLVAADAYTTHMLLPSGIVETYHRPNPPRQHEVADIQSLSDFVSDLDNVVIWHHNDQVVAVLNDADWRDNTVSMPLPHHPKFTALAHRCFKNPVTQKELIDFLRLNLKQEITRDAPGLIENLRAIKFVSNEAGESNVQHGRESMGRRIEQSVTGADALPEEVTITLPIWLHLEFEVAIECALMVDTAEQKFRFGPKPGVIAQCEVAGQKWLGGRLQTECEGAAIYFGKP